MKEIIKNKEKYKEKFDSKKFNDNIISSIEILINGGNSAKN